MTDAVAVFRWMTTAHVVTCGVLLFRDGRRERYAPYLATFLLGVLCYLHGPPAYAGPPPYAAWVHLVVFGRGLVPLACWLFSQALFDDGFRLRPWHGAVAALQLGFHHLAFLAARGHPIVGPWLGPRGVSIAVALAVACAFALIADVVYRVVGQASDDLVESRRRLRYVYVRAAGAYIVIAALVNGASAVFGPLAAWPLLDAGGVYGLMLGFSLTQMRLDVGRTAPRALADLPPDLAERLQRLMTAEEAFRTSGLTIGRLAERLGQPEHKVRALINGQLGFRNFSAFLNSYRTGAAADALRDPEQDHLTVAEIAFGLGYQSLGPFNRAFKEARGQTPTEFRRSSRA
jgi:AraC-like DNA-binding protein